ncbi:MAG: hypothetical protein K2H76_03625, partial [Muribaculaceae bacterium]|nr:hypothetical protein [Muribaculaceae bacterium]
MLNPHHIITRFLITLSFLAVIKPFIQAEERLDTIIALDSARNITVTQTPGKARIYADFTGKDGKESFFYYTLESSVNEQPLEDYDSGWSISLPYYYYKRGLSANSMTQILPHRSNRIMRELIIADCIYSGLRMCYNEKGAIKNSLEAGVRNLIGLRWRRGLKGPSFSIGVGFGFLHLATNMDMTFRKDGDKLILSKSMQPEGEVKGSSMDLYTIHVPLMLRQNIGRYCYFTLGGSFNLNVYASASMETGRNNIDNTIRYKELQQRLLTADIFASVNLFGIGVYA